MTEDKQYDGLDYFKITAAFLVIAIHTSPFASFSEGADFIFTRVIARTAVPFFFMVTGYFLLPQYLFGRSMDQRPLLHSIKKHMLLYAAAILLYLPVGLYAGHFEEMSAGGFLRMLLVDGTFYHLWYLPAALLGMVIVWFMGTRLPFGALTGISVVLYAVGLFGDSYYGLTMRIPFLKEIYDVIFSVSSYTRNGLFYAPVFLVMGAEANRGICRRMALKGDMQSEAGIPKMAYAAGLTVSLVLMTMEGLLLRGLDLQRHDSMYVMLLPVMFFLFRVLLSGGKARETFRASSAENGGSLHGEEQHRRRGKKLRWISTWIYIIHPLCIILVRGAAKAVHLEKLFVENSLAHYLAVCAVSFTGACAITMIAENFVLSKFFLGKEERNDRKGRVWIELSRENLAENVEVLQGLLSPGQQLMPAVKADAYGHGAELIAGELNKMGIQRFCVACVSEGISLRKNGITGDILILGYTHPKDFPALRKYRLTQTVVDYAYGRVLNGYGRKIKVHVKIDTGMHRLGEQAEKRKEIGRIFRLRNLEIEGIYTHLCADETRDPGDAAFTKKQTEYFYEVVKWLEERGISGLKTHLLASYGLLNYPEAGGDYVRAGIALYGLLSEKKGGEDEERTVEKLRPVLSLWTRIAVTKEIYAGESVGYGCAYVAEDTRKIAVLSIGYADGLPRSLSGGRGRVLIHGQSAPVLGRICMDQTIVDITEIPGVKAGEIATVIGRSGDQEITAYELAENAGTITNEILSRMGGRVQRIMT